MILQAAQTRCLFCSYSTKTAPQGKSSLRRPSKRTADVPEIFPALYLKKKLNRCILQFRNFEKEKHHGFGITFKPDNICHFNAVLLPDNGDCRHDLRC